MASKRKTSTHTSQRGSPGAGRRGSSRPHSAELVPVGGRIERLPREGGRGTGGGRPSSTPSGNPQQQQQHDLPNGSDSDAEEAGTFLTSIASSSETALSPGSRRSTSPRERLPQSIRGSSEGVGAAGHESSNSVDAGSETARRRALLLGSSRSEQARADLRAHLTSLTERKDSQGNQLVSFSEKFIRQVKVTSSSSPQPNAQRAGATTTNDAHSGDDSDAGEAEDSCSDDDEDDDDDSYSMDSGSTSDEEEIEDEPDVAHISAVLPSKAAAAAAADDDDEGPADVRRSRTAKKDSEKKKKKKKKKKTKKRRQKSKHRTDSRHSQNSRADDDVHASAVVDDNDRGDTRSALVASPLRFIDEVEEQADEDPNAALNMFNRPSSALLVAEVVGTGDINGTAGSAGVLGEVDDDGGGVKELRHWQAAVAAQNIRRAEIMGPSKSDIARAELRAHLASLSTKVAFSEEFVKEVEASDQAARSRDARVQQLLEDDGGEEVLYEDRSDDDEEEPGGDAAAGGASSQALLGKRPTEARSKRATDEDKHSQQLAFEPVDFNVALELGLDAGDDESALSKEERARLARLLADPGKDGGGSGHGPDLDEEESKIRDIQAAQRRLKEIDAQLRALQTPRVLLNSVGTKTTDSEQSVSNTPFGVLRTSDSFHSSISTLEQNPEASPVSPSHSPKSAAESPKTALASEDRSKEKANGSDAEMSPAKQLALRKEKRLQRERLKDIDKRLAQLRASDHNGDVTKNLLPREHIDCMVREMGQEYTVGTVPVAARTDIQNLLSDLLNPSSARKTTSAAAPATTPFAAELERHAVNGKTIAKITMRDLMAMEVGSMVQRRALLKLVDRSKREGVPLARLQSGENAKRSGTPRSHGPVARTISPKVSRPGNGRHTPSSGSGSGSGSSSSSSGSPRTRFLRAGGGGGGGGGGGAKTPKESGNSTVSGAGRFRKSRHADTSPKETRSGTPTTNSEPVTLRETVTQLRDRGRKAMGATLGTKAAAAARKAAQARTNGSSPKRGEKSRTARK